MAQEPPGPASPGTDQRRIAGRYRLDRPLGSGGFGQVWLAHDERLDARVVVKEVRIPATSPEEHAKRVRYAEREARNAARLREHPGIVTVHDVVIEDDRPWIVMEYIDGGSLEERLASGPLDPDETARLARAILGALDTAHKVGVVHRDVKPSNIMLATDGRILLTDFGLAAHHADTRLTVSGEVVGTLDYLAPERLDSGKVAPACDLFSLGVTLYRSVEGFSPFLRDSTTATLAALVTKDPPPPKRAGALAPLILGLLAKDPANRLTVDGTLALLNNQRTNNQRINTVKVPDRPPDTVREPGGQRPPGPVTEATEIAATARRPGTPPWRPSPDGSFDVTWTGSAPLNTYSTPKTTWVSWQTWAIWAVILTIAGFALLGAGLSVSSADTSSQSGLEGTGGFFIAVALVSAEFTYFTRSFARVHEMPPSWTLHVGPDLIMTTSIAGRREFTWDRIEGVHVREIRYEGPYRFSGLFLDLSSPAQLNIPAGWPHRRPTRYGMTTTPPVCVLGPMTPKQLSELSAALARYAGVRWNPAELPA